MQRQVFSVLAYSQPKRRWDPVTGVEQLLRRDAHEGIQVVVRYRMPVNAEAVTERQGCYDPR